MWYYEGDTFTKYGNIGPWFHNFHICFRVVCLTVPLGAHAVFERFTDGECHNLSGTADARAGSLEQVDGVPAIQR